MDYTLVFDAATRSPPVPTLLPVGFVLFGVVLLVGAGRGLPQFHARAYLFPAFWFTISCGATAAMLGVFLGDKGEGCAVVEGTVDGYAADAKSESFTLAGERYVYSDYVMTRAFNHMASRGGPIRASQRIRACVRDHAIWRLEIAASDLAEPAGSPGAWRSLTQPQLAFVLPFALFPVVIGAMSFLSGWRSLSNRYPRRRAPSGAGFPAQSLQIGFLGNYRGIMNMALSDDALWITPVTLFAAFHPPLEIPRSAFVKVEDASSFLGSRTRITLATGEYLMLSGDVSRALD